MNGNPLPLRDIHLPEAVSWWPPAPGWWLLLLLALLATVLLQWWWRRRHRRHLQHSALQELRAIEAAYRQATDDLQLVQNLSVLLRRVSLSRFDREQVAGLSGEAWLQWLDRQQEHDDFQHGVGRALLEAPYRRTAEVDAMALLALCERWLRQVTRPARGAP